jgi:hypothetical protein
MSVAGGLQNLQRIFLPTAIDVFSNDKNQDSGIKRIDASSVRSTESQAKQER